MKVIIGVVAICVDCFLVHKFAKKYEMSVVNWFAIALVFYACLNFENAIVFAMLLLCFICFGYFAYAMSRY